MSYLLDTNVCIQYLDRDWGWTPGFFERTAGSWQGEPLERGDQGKYDERDWSFL